MKPRLLGALLLLALWSSLPVAAATFWVLGGGGIHRAELDVETGAISTPERVAELSPASWLVTHPTKPVLYASYSSGKDAGVASFAYESDGSLTPQSTVVLPSGWPTHLTVNPQGTVMASAHYGAGTISLVNLRADGSLRADEAVTTFTVPFQGQGPAPVQSQSRPHWVGFTPDGALLHAPDLGNDAIWTFRVSTAPLALTIRDRLAVPAGAGPRHLDFHPSKRFAYANGEVGQSLITLTYDTAAAKFGVVETVPVLRPDDHEPANSTSEVRVHPSGRFVYVGNRGHDSISVFALDPANGHARLVETEAIRGIWPRNFNLDPSGRWLIAAGRYSDSLTSFAIDAETGELTFSRQIAPVPGPVRVLFVP